MNKREFGRNLAELLQTEDKEEQLNVIRSIIQAAQTPVIDVVVRFDPRSGQVSTGFIGTARGQMTYQQAMDILELGKKQLQEREKQELLAQQAEDRLGDPTPLEEETEADDQGIGNE